jgi:hypothetical protein
VPNADFFVVMTLQRGEPPPLTVTGNGMEATVRAGTQEVRFQDGRLFLKEW